MSKMRSKQRTNRYFKGSHLTEGKFRKILKEFCFDTTATEATKRTHVSRETVTKLYHQFRLRIKDLAEKEEKEIFDTEAEIDESYFGPRRVRGKRGRGAGLKTPVFGVLKRKGKVYTKIVRNCSKDELLPILKGKILAGSTVYSDGWKAYDGLVYNYDHYRVHHAVNEFARGKNHINGIESFWGWSKRRLVKFNGIKKEHFHLFLKECEFRFNHRDDMYTILLKNFTNYPINGAKVL
jgi:transposase